MEAWTGSFLPPPRVSWMVPWANSVPGGGGHPARADAKLGVLLIRLVARTSVAPTRPPLSDRCSQFAHRRCAYSWTSQHTYVASMQVRRTTVDAPVPGGTG